MIRALIAAIGYGSLFVGLPIVTAVCILLLALRYRAWEAVLLGLFVDFMWLPSEYALYTLPYFTLGSIIVVWGLEPLRRQFLR
jgi:hypothetical protein